MDRCCGVYSSSADWVAERAIPPAQILTRPRIARDDWRRARVVVLVPQSTEIRISLLGSFELSRDGEALDVAIPAQRVLALLALHEQPVPRNRIAAELWLDANEDRAAGSLRSALWRIRRYGEWIVQRTPRGLELSPAVSVDVHDAVAWARRVGDTGHTIQPSDIRHAVVGGELLPEWSDDWVVLERERLRQLRLHALEALSHRLVTAGRFAEALDVALVALGSEPLRESAHRAAISVHLAEGNQSEALRQYRHYRELLSAAFGLEPSTLITGLVNALDMREATG
jgi:DNA-binding SARP family transcriptional activator